MDKDSLYQEGIKKRQGELNITWDELNHSLGNHFTNGTAYANFVKRRLKKEKEKESKEVVDEHEVTYLKDGMQRSVRLLEMSKLKNKSVDYLLKEHGYDPNEWELEKHKWGEWNQHNKKDGTVVLYASNLIVKPKINGYHYDNLIKIIQDTPPVSLIKNKSAPLSMTDYIEISLFDMHWGIATSRDYKRTQEKIQGRLEHAFKDVLFIIGQDLLHNDNFKGETSKGTVIDKVDMEKAWGEALHFYDPLIYLALENSKKVNVMYSIGNHDESMSWAFVQMLKSRYPEAKFNDRFKERKVHMLGKNFIGVNHGDKVKEDNLTQNFAHEFPVEWAKATSRTIHTGHRHTERVVDKAGVLLRRLPTRVPIDEYHDKFGYTMAHKRFQIFEYSEHAVEAIYYV